MATGRGRSEQISDTIRDSGKPKTEGTITSPTQRSGAVTDAELDRPESERDNAPVRKGERLRKTHVDREVTET